MADTGYKYATAQADPGPDPGWGPKPSMASIQTEDNYGWGCGQVYPNWAVTNLYNFDIAIDAGKQIDGIEVKWRVGNPSHAVAIELYTRLSWDGGSNWVQKYLVNWSQPQGFAYWTYGGSSDLWGRTWSPSEFSNANFRLQMKGRTHGSTFDTDFVLVKVSYSDPPTTEISKIGGIALASIAKIGGKAVANIAKVGGKEF